MEEQTKKSPTEAFTDLMMKFSGPVAKFAELPAIQAVQNGLIAVMPLIIIGSLFLIIALLGTDAIGGVVLLPFISPFTEKLLVMNSLTMSFLSAYCAVAIPMSYAEKLGENQKTCGVLGLAIFFVFTLNGVVDGQISVTAFSATGLFAVIISSLLGVRLYKLVTDRNITIKMPESVPPAIGNAFTSLIPFAVVLTVCWFIRTLLDFDLVAFLTTALTPLVSAADNMGVYVLDRTVSALLWSVGLHGDNMWTTPIFQPFTLMWTEENAAAMAAGQALPHIWTNSGIDRISTWPALVWPLIFLMVTSKVKYLRTLGWACLPAAVFTIVEPVIFGLPVALNPFLIIPFIIIALVSAVFSYGFFALGLCAKFFVTMPWATPPFILGPLGTGDFRALIVTAGCFIIGLLIYIPFWRMFEKHLLEEEEKKAAKKAARKAAREAAKLQGDAASGIEAK